MGMAILCDGCGIDVATLDKINLNFGSIETGSVQADLCLDCAAPILKTPIWKKLIADSTAAVEAENARRQEVMRQQQEELDARSQVMLEQQREARDAAVAAATGE